MIYWHFYFVQILRFLFLLNYFDFCSLQRKLINWLLNDCKLTRCLLMDVFMCRCCGASRAADGGTQLTCALQVTELVGAVSMLYGALLRQGAPPRGGPAPPPPLPPHTAAVALATFKLLARVAELHLPLFQVSIPHIFRTTSIIQNQSTDRHS